MQNGGSMIWPRNAFPGQYVAAITTSGPIVKGKVYVIREVIIRNFPTAKNVVYFKINECHTHYIRYDLFKPLDPSRLEVFKNVSNGKNLVRENAL